MPSYYTYLISSLPALSFGAKPPFSLDDFFDTCSQVISKADMEKVREAVDIPDYRLKEKDAGVLKEWHIFNFSLRNELARARSGRKKADPLRYTRSDINTFSASVAHTAMSAYRNLNILDAERSLDSERWRFLDEASLGHYFDVDSLITYALKLKILVRWDKIDNADREKLLKEALAGN